MKTLHQSNWLWRPAGTAVIATLALPTLMAGCGSSAPAPQMQPSSSQSAPQGAPQAAPVKSGMTTRQKVTLLAGAAAMFYLYKKYQRDNAATLQKAQAQAPGGKIQYYRSESQGYIYYRDPVTHAPIIVSRPSTSPVQVPADQAQDYQNFQGYNNSTSGETLDKYFPVK